MNEISNEYLQMASELLRARMALAEIADMIRAWLPPAAVKAALRGESGSGIVQAARHLLEDLAEQQSRVDQVEEESARWLRERDICHSMLTGLGVPQDSVAELDGVKATRPALLQERIALMAECHARSEQARQGEISGLKAYSEEYGSLMRELLDAVKTHLEPLLLEEGEVETGARVIEAAAGEISLLRGEATRREQRLAMLDEGTDALLRACESCGWKRGTVEDFVRGLSEQVRTLTIDREEAREQQSRAEAEHKDLLRELATARQDAESAFAERNAAREDLQAELDGRAELRRRYGAREDETFGEFVGRLGRVVEHWCGPIQQQEQRKADLGITTTELVIPTEAHPRIGG